jgi:hypothetical protein
MVSAMMDPVDIAVGLISSQSSNATSPYTYDTRPNTGISFAHSPGLLDQKPRLMPNDLLSLSEHEGDLAKNNSDFDLFLYKSIEHLDSVNKHVTRQDSLT